ncbi:MAG: lysophospholipid acyltransferase family protein [bacterium]|nr:lysophospholipid acyltransferase family protein [bacterium]
MKPTKGLENVPAQGPFIIACKHVGSMVDGIFVGAVIIPKIDQKIHFISLVAEWGRFWKQNVAEQWAGVIPYLEEDPRVCLDKGLDLLKQGKVVGIFPEGILKNNQNNNGSRIKTGVARLAILSQLPILPIGLDYQINDKDGLKNMQNYWHVMWQTIFNPQSVQVIIGQPFEISEYYSKEFNREMLFEASNYIMTKIEKISKVTINNH